MKDKKVSFWNSDATKYMAVLYLGYILGRGSEALPSILAVPIEIMGFASIVIVLINFVKGKLHKAE